MLKKIYPKMESLMSNQEDILDPEEISAEISRFSEESESDVQTLEETEGITESADIEGTELDQFETADIEELLFIEEEHIESILESLLFASDKPVSFATMKELFRGTNVSKEHLKRAIDKLSVEYAGSRRGVVLEDVSGGYQLRTKVDNMSFLRRLLKGRSFRLSGPALEVLSIVAYKQPVIKSEIDVIRGVESGHLLRALMEKGLVTFEGKSDLPGRPMQYSTTKKFLEIFGLRNLKELPTLSQIDELLPEGIGAEEEKKETLSDITDTMAQTVVSTYSDSEEDLEKIQSALSSVDTTTAFFEEEKKRIKLEENKARAQDIREAISVGEAVDSKDIKWLSKFEAEQAALIASSVPQTIVEEVATEPAPEETPQA
jgi:segregation and condensation protein B